jgi:ribosomal protein S21
MKKRFTESQIVSAIKKQEAYNTPHFRDQKVAMLS